MVKGLERARTRGRKNTKSIVKDRIDLTGRTVTVSATGSAIGFGSAVIHDFPEGNILLLGIGGTVGFAGSGADGNLTDTWSGDFGIGSTPADDATITGTDVDILASTAIGAATDEVIAAARFAEAHGDAILDNTDGSLEVNLNLLIDAANIVDDESVVITLSGALDLAYIVLGNAFVHPSGGSGVWPVLPGDPITMECTGTFPSGNGSDFNADDTYYGRIVSEASDHQLRLYPTAQDAIDETNLIQFGFAGTGTLSFFTADVVQEVETIFDALTELGWLRLQGIDDPGDLPS